MDQINTATISRAVATVLSGESPPLESEVSLAARRLRDQIANGSLAVSGTIHPGTGRPRYYRPWILPVAVALAALSELNQPPSTIYGVGHGLTGIAKAVADADVVGKTLSGWHGLWAQACRGEPRVWLVVYPGPILAIVDAQRLSAELSKSTAAVVLNLSELLGRITKVDLS
jgi:hypothetical protein